MGRIDRACVLTAQETNELSKKRKEKATQQIISLAESDFVAGERAYADYVDMCKTLGIAPQDVDPACQCEYCQRVPKGAELLFALETA
jgi:hypothetical protein